MAEIDDAAEPGTADGSGALPADERALLEAFDRLAPAGSVRWGFDDALRRLSSPAERGTWVEPWHGLPADLWDRGRGARASERVLGDVITTLAQELTEYTQRVVDDVRRTVPVDSAVFDALRYLAARVERLEGAVDPFDVRPAELALPSPDASEWSEAVADWLGDPVGRPVVVGELVDRTVLDAVAATGADVDAVDPHAALTWTLQGDAPGRPGQVLVTAAEVVDHLHRLPVASRAGLVLIGCIDRASPAGKADLVDSAIRALAPGGALVLLVSDQAMWDGSLDPPVRDLLPGRPFHPDTWRVLLARAGLDALETHPAARGQVHAVVARRPW